MKKSKWHTVSIKQGSFEEATKHTESYPDQGKSITDY